MITNNIFFHDESCEKSGISVDGNKLLPEYSILLKCSIPFELQIFRTLIETGILDMLHKDNLSLDELTYKIDADKVNLYRILRASVFLKILALNNGKYCLDKYGQALLNTKKYRIYNQINMMISEYFDGLYSLPDKIKKNKKDKTYYAGEDIFSYFNKNKERSEVFSDSMAELSGQALPYILKYDFTGINTIADIGGGYGQVLFPLLNKFDKIKGILFDCEIVIEKARENNRFGSRCEFVAGSFFESLNIKPDLIILKWILHDWDDEHSLIILKNCCEILEKGNKLLVIETMIERENDVMMNYYLDIIMMTLFGGKERTEEEFKVLFKESGFELNKIIDTKSPFKIIEAVKK
ncbi:hypothetical protein KA977_12300 [Candidatus Dependentiae bacterium]|nr:hypothetical protein [Candidatus Dependentiae bacterium]